MLSIGITGIHAAQQGLDATQHNIANANTPGYSRQYIQQSAGVPHLTGSGYFGSGTTVDTVRRAYDKYLTAQTFTAQTSASESETQLAQLSQLDNMLGDPNSGLAPALQDFFTGVQQVAANPAQVSARQGMLASAQALAGRFNSMSTRLGELYDGVNGQVTSEAQVINSFAQQLADINGQITRAQASTDQSPNDLLDMRDQLVAELNKHIRVTTVQDSAGNFNAFIGNGQQLVVGSVVNKLVPMTSSSDPERVVIGLQGQAGNVQELSESAIDGGVMGGLMKFRSNTLDGATNSLGQIAASLALTFNAQHALGQDLNGQNQTSAAPGFQADFFQYSQPKVIAASAGANVVSASFLAPTGNPASGNFKSNLTGSDYILRATSASSMTLTRVSDGVVFPATGAAGSIAALNALIVGEGISLGGSAPTVGVDYRIEPTRDAAKNFQVNSTIAADVKRIAAGSPSITTLAMANTGTLSVSQGIVSPGYSLANVPAVFTYSQASGAFTFAFPATGTVSATYADGNTAFAAVGSISRLNGTGSELTRIVYNGISIDVSGVPANGDTFTIAQNANGVSDSRNAVKLASLQTQNAMQGGNATYQGTYASLVSKVGSVTRQVTSEGASQKALLAQDQTARSAVSGVNLDEEAANLIRYQQAYQAASKSLSIAAKLFDTLLAI
jgi:flagellar hook-associated protein 1 FlgK